MNKEFEFGVFDIEAWGWKNFLLAGFYDGFNYCEFDSMDKLICYLFDDKCRVAKVFAHFGGIYDFLFVLQCVFESNKNFKVYDFIPRGSGILCFTCEYKTKKITFWDSGALLNFSLKKVTQALAPEYAKKEMDVSNLPSYVTPKLREYLRFDCLGLWHSLKNFSEDKEVKKAGMKFTTASQAAAIFKLYQKEPIPSCPKSFDAFIRPSYAGGRTEIFKPLFESKTEKIFCYDVNSLYPFCMRENEFPTVADNVSRELDLERMGFCKAVIFQKEMYMPVMWTKAEKFIFPVGVIEGTWPICELKYALEIGAIEIMEVKACVYFKNGGPIFREFIDAQYEKRMEAKKRGDEVGDIVAKLTMNSLYGRMGLNLEREGMCIDEGQVGIKPTFEIQTSGGVIRFAKFDHEINAFSNVAIASYVTALARIHMHKLISPFCEDHGFYMDTDSIFTTKKLPSSKKLGELKLEYEEKRACFVLPKTYIVGEKQVMKGFSRKSANFSFEDFQAQLAGEIRLKEHQEGKLSRFKTAMRHGSFLHVGKAKTKRVISKYDKRELIEVENNFWDSAPLNGVWFPK